MNPSPRRPLKALLPLLMLFALLLGAGPARAAGISCSNTAMTALSFGTVNPLSSQTNATATLSYSCSNNDTKTHSALVCFHIGEPFGRQPNPRLMLNGTNTLQFQMYQDPARTIIWGSLGFGSPTPLAVPITLNRGTSMNGTATLYGQVLGGQTAAIPGNYQDVYQNNDTAVSINDSVGTTAPGACSGTFVGLYFPFTVSATVSKQCIVTAVANINLGSFKATAAPINANGNTNIVMTCSNTTPYFVGLLPSNNNNAGAGVMSGTGTNTDKVPYQLYSNAGLNTIWGNTATSSSVGNGVTGTGTGGTQSIPVYAQATSADFQPDTYTDTVVVHVNY